ncbi:MAG: ATP-binding protein [Saprospiraceae bacterium]|nr:ATP-binding protein [Saprospiraceae bacterium]
MTVIKQYFANLPIIVTIKITASVVLLAAGLYYFYQFVPRDSQIVWSVIFIFLFFSGCFVIIFYLLTRYFKIITGRIYEILDEFREDDQKYGKIKNLYQFEKEIGTWAETKSTEINKLKDMEAYRKEFLGNVSHELKTPLFIAQSYIETLIDGSLYDNKVNQKHLDKALKSILRLSQIVKDLEMISKLEKSSLVIERNTFDMNKLVKEVVDSLELSAKEENIRFSINIPQEQECKVLADEEKIEQVLTNLLVNALKYSKEKGKIEIGCKDLKNKYLIEISDNGIGIKKENIDRIFERFYRIDRDRSRKKGGTGLGLSIVKHILEAHNESITVESEIGKGSKFSFTLDKAEK